MNYRSCTALALTIDNLRGSMDGNKMDKMMLLRFNKHIIPEIKELKITTASTIHNQGGAQA